MVKVLTQMLSISLNRPGYTDLVHDISLQCVSMLRHIEQSKPHEILGMLLEALVTEIEVSIHT